MKPLTNDCMYNNARAHDAREMLCEFVNTSMNDIYQNYVRVYGPMDDDQWVEMQQLLTEFVS